MRLKIIQVIEIYREKGQILQPSDLYRKRRGPIGGHGECIKITGLQRSLPTTPKRRGHAFLIKNYMVTRFMPTMPTTFKTCFFYTYVCERFAKMIHFLACFLNRHIYNIHICM